MAVAEASAGAQDGWRLLTSFMKWFRYALLGVSSPIFAQGLQAEELEGVVAGTVVVMVELIPDKEVEEGVLLELVGALGMPLGGRGVAWVLLRMLNGIWYIDLDFDVITGLLYTNN